MSAQNSFNVKCAKGPIDQPAQYIDNANIVTVCGKQVTFTSPYIHRSDGFTPQILGISSFCTDHDDMFAIAEWNSDPSIFIYRYPFFQNIAKLDGGAKIEYIAIQFSSNSLYLAGLSGVPDYTLYLWKISSENLIGQINIGYTSNPLLRFSPAAVLRMALSTENEVAFIEVDETEEGTTLTRRPVKLGKVSHHCWDVNDDLLCSVNEKIIRVDGLSLECKDLHIYSDTTLDQKIVSIAMAANNVVAATENGSIFILEKRSLKNDWKAKLLVNLESTTKGISVSPDKMYIIHTSCHSVVTIIHMDRGSKIRLAGFEDSVFPVTDACVLEPMNEHIVSAHSPSSVCVWKVDGNRKLVANITVGREITCITADSYGPWCFLGTIDSHLFVVDLVRPATPRIVWSSRFSKAAVKQITPSNSDSVAAVLCGEHDIFILNTLPSSQFTIKAKLTVQGEIKHIVTCMYKAKSVVAALIETPTKLRCYIRLYIFNSDEVISVEYGLGSSCNFFSLTDDISVAFVSCSQSYNINMITLSDPDDMISAQISILTKTFSKDIDSGHLMDIIGVLSQSNFVLTSSNDGLVSVMPHDFFNEDDRKVYLPQPKNARTHQPHTYGIKKFNLTKNLKYGMSIGNDGSFVLLQMFPNEFTHPAENTDEEKGLSEQKIIRSMESVNQQTVGVSQSTWEETLAENAWKKDEERLLQIKTQLRDSFLEIKEELTQMLNVNEEMDDLDKLPTIEFELDAEEQVKFESGLHQKLAQIRDETLNEIAKNICIKNRLKQKYWESMSVKGKSISGFLTKIEVSNYPIPDKSMKEKVLLEEICFRRELEAYEKTVLNYLNKSTDKIQPKLDSKMFDLNDTDYYENSSIPSSDRSSLDVHLQWEIPQLSVVSRKQKIDMIHLLIDAVSKLKINFNSKFDKLCEKKKLEMGRIKKQNDRLKEIYNDLGVDKTPWGPILSGDEEPDNYFFVREEIIKAERYIIPSEQTRLEKLVLDEENARLQKLKANEFKERALIKMMDGVLEVKWEDKLKKDIPRPEFMDYKLPEEWSLEEMAKVEEYEAKCVELEQNRQSYRRMLEREEVKILSILENITSSFDKDIKELLQLKIETASVIAQEELRVAKYQFDIARGDIGIQESEKISQEIDQLQLRNVSIQSVTARLKQALQSYKSQQEPLYMQQKYYEKVFKKEFAGNYAADSLFELFKYRPPDFTKMINQFERKRNSIIQAPGESGQAKIKQKTPNSKDNKPAMPYNSPNKKNRLNIINKSGSNKTGSNVIAKNKETKSKIENDNDSFKVENTGRKIVPIVNIMSKEKLIDLMNTADDDKNKPDLVDTKLWTKMCRLRREIIFNEYAYVQKAQMMANIGIAIEKRQKWENALNARLRSLFAKSVELRKAHEIVHQDPEIQIVLKLGQVEMELGDFCPDFSDAVLLPKSKVEDLNKQISAAGQKKIDVMKDAMKFRSGIMMQSWLAKRWQMTIEDIEQKLKDITFMKLTRKLQQFLREGRDPDELEIIKLEKRLDGLEDVADKQRQEDTDIEVILKRLKRLKQIENQRLEVEAYRLQLDASERQILFDVQCNRKKKSQIRERLSILRKVSQLFNLAKNQQTMMSKLQSEIEKLCSKRYPTFTDIKETKLSQ